MKLFLSSYFKCVASLLTNYAQCEGEKVVFITTASKFEKVNFYVKADRNALSKLGFIVEELDVSIEKPVEIKEKIETCDCIFVEGGNTFFLLQELKRSGADKIADLHRQTCTHSVRTRKGATAIAAAPFFEYLITGERKEALQFVLLPTQM